MAGEEPEYCQFVRQLQCSMYGHTKCIGSMHAHHPQGGKGMGTRNHDERTVPLCAGHHTDRHALSGPFKGWGKVRIRAWEAAVAGVCRGLYLGVGEQADVGPEFRLLSSKDAS